MSPSTNSQRYVVVEYRGGPRDGVREVWPHPLPTHDIVFPSARLESAAAWPSAAASNVDYVTHRYATTDTGYDFDIVTVDAELAARVGERHVNELVLQRGRRPVVFTHRG